MHRYVHRAGVGVIAWRQGATSSAAGTLAPADRHRRLVSRGRVVRVAAGYGAVAGGDDMVGPTSFSITATATASALGELAGLAVITFGAAGSLETLGSMSGSSVITFGATGTASSTGSPLGTIGRPISDTSNTGWTASTGVDLYAMVDEVTPSAVDYISATSVGAICEMALNPTAYPGTASQNLKFNASSSTGNSVIVRIKNGATIRTETQVLTPTDTQYTITLTSGEIAAITSGALSVELESA